MWPITASRC
ncbi:hypothetical protein LINPERPRIM_LOCUS34045 [Linum perenne]